MRIGMFRSTVACLALALGAASPATAAELIPFKIGISAPSQIGGQLRQAIHVILGPAIENCDAVALDIAHLLQAQVKCARPSRVRR